MVSVPDLHVETAVSGGAQDIHDDPHHPRPVTPWQKAARQPFLSCSLQPNTVTSRTIKGAS